MVGMGGLLLDCSLRAGKMIITVEGYTINSQLPIGLIHILRVVKER